MVQFFFHDGRFGIVLSVLLDLVTISIVFSMVKDRVSPRSGVINAVATPFHATTGTV